jgi:hypothetical protein
MSRARGAGWCHKAMWWGWGGDAGCCDRPAFGPTPKGYAGVPLSWACPTHGGPPEVPETALLREGAIKRELGGTEPGKTPVQP